MFKVDMWFVIKDGRGRDRVVVEFTITCAISAYHHESCEFESPHDEVHSMQLYVIKVDIVLR